MPVGIAGSQDRPPRAAGRLRAASRKASPRRAGAPGPKGCSPASCVAAGGRPRPGCASRHGEALASGRAPGVYSFAPFYPPQRLARALPLLVRGALWLLPVVSPPRCPVSLGIAPRPHQPSSASLLSSAPSRSSTTSPYRSPKPLHRLLDGFLGARIRSKALSGLLSPQGLWQGVAVLSTGTWPPSDSLRAPEQACRAAHAGSAARRARWGASHHLRALTRAAARTRPAGARLALARTLPVAAAAGAARKMFLRGQ